MSDHYGFETLATTVEDRILTVRFNRPDRLNALNALMHSELRDLYGRIERDTAVDVVVLTGAGKAFCVGADFDQMEENLARGGYPDGHPSLLGEAATMARKLAAGPQIALRFNKRLVNKDLEERVNKLYDLSLALEAITFETQDHQEAVRAFLEKRPATWAGR